VFRVPVLVLAALLSTPALWSAFVDGTMSIETALVRFLIAVPIAALMVVAFRATMGAYEREATLARARANQKSSEGS
jgi:hypothetical protein